MPPPTQTSVNNLQRVMVNSRYSFIRRCEAISFNGTYGVCKWDYDGQGLQYELLAGPVFIIVYSVAAVPIGILADFYDRRVLLAASLALSSAMTLVSGFTNRYWQLVLTRFAIGVRYVYANT